ncbi:MAG: M24 family metallopeptidase, partial [Nanoarchaeota archaeon]|nr:M24 family metallopeptidase [Nanoarchaeota archaeon]
MAKIKTKQEIKYIKKACKITTKIFKSVLKSLKMGQFKTEKEIYVYLLYETKKLNLRPAFGPIVASGSNATKPHHKATNLPLKKGFLVIDYGVKYNGYCADMTRTFYLSNPNQNHIKLYNKILNVQKNCIKQAKPNKSCQELHNFAANQIKYLIHGLGHGLGKKIHESPRINSKSKDILQKNMA